MKQILQSLKSGETALAEVPSPRLLPGHLLVRSSRTLISAGTERMLVKFGKAGLLEKARSQPDKVRQVLQKIRTDGLLSTIETVRNKLDEPLPLGYCNTGVIIEVGKGVSGFSPGDRVASNGKHAEIVSVPANLCARVPDSVTDDAAVFTVIGAIALQGVRLAQPTLGECFVVSGLGLIGLLTVQLLRAQGCRVLGIDYAPDRLELAKRFGAEVVDLSAGADPVATAQVFSRGQGVDGVLIAATTETSEPVHQAARMCRKRGRIILVGVTGLELSRADFYEKELSFQVSCSYGPGRYDPKYEDEGHDYPIGFVRWTEQRNFEAVLDMLTDRRLDVNALITHRFPLDRAVEAYQLVSSDDPSLGIVLEFPMRSIMPEVSARMSRVRFDVTPSPAKLVVGVLGAGNYARAVLVPALRSAGVRLKTVASSGGVTGVHVGRKFGFEETTTDTDAVFADPEINTVVIATRHSSHAPLVCQALAAGKHVFVEKPLAIDRDGLSAVIAARTASPQTHVMVGFNRRFSPHVQKIKSLLVAVSEPKVFMMVVNAGAIPAAHWTQDPREGGGRIVGEACHFVDLLRFLAGSPIDSVSAQAMEGSQKTHDNVTITIRFVNGSLGTVHYLANGHKSFPKERLEVFAGGRILQLDNFRILRSFGWPGFSGKRLWQQDKGNSACVAAFVSAVERGHATPIAFEELIEVSEQTLRIAEIAVT